MFKIKKKLIVLLLPIILGTLFIIDTTGYVDDGGSGGVGNTSPYNVHYTVKIIKDADKAKDREDLGTITVSLYSILYNEPGDEYFIDCFSRYSTDVFDSYWSWGDSLKNEISASCDTRGEPYQYELSFKIRFYYDNSPSKYIELTITLIIDEDTAPSGSYNSLKYSIPYDICYSTELSVSGTNNP
ncbi:MAG: hypothetical protein ACTSWC_12270 [Promethearchaeota archaeon]